jgi:hypothetical protein
MRCACRFPRKPGGGRLVRYDSTQVAQRPIGPRHSRSGHSSVRVYSWSCGVWLDPCLQDTPCGATGGAGYCGGGLLSHTAWHFWVSCAQKMWRVFVGWDLKGKWGSTLS